MENLKLAVEHAKAIVAEAEAYEAKPTKAGSARLRKSINEGKKVATKAKLELIEADKA